MMIERPNTKAQIDNALRRSRVAVLIGPRQSGKTTLARQYVQPDSLNYFDLEDPISLARLEQPMTALRNLEGLVVIDEVQRRPDRFICAIILHTKQISKSNERIDYNAYCLAEEDNN